MSIAAFGLPIRPALSQSSIVVPTSPMVFRRRLERSLRDGNRLIVEREWRLQFSRQGRGIAISGEQTAVSLQAPPKLERLAALEKQRSTASMWPILLSDSGRILAENVTTPREDIDRAVEIARGIIAREPSTAQTKQARMRDLAMFEKAGSEMMARMPGDLFYPDAQPVHLVRSVSLPDGLEGEYEMIYTSRQSRTGNWLDRAQREVITRIDHSERRSREEWTLRPA